MTVGDAVQRFKLVQVVMVLLVGLAVAIGFDFKTPAHHFHEIEATAQTIDRRVAVLELDRVAVQRYLRVLVLSKCFEVSRQEAVLIGLPCDSLRQHGAL